MEHRFGGRAQTAYRRAPRPGEEEYLWCLTRPFLGEPLMYTFD